jgi:hypothetical protein
MNYYTRKKIEFLQDYLANYYKDWLKIHGDNISGFSIDKKNGKGNYCIIFHVGKKLDTNELKESNIIPPYFEISFPNGEIKKIKTDIEETGFSSLQFSLCQKNLPYGNRALGTVGVFVKDVNNYVYAVTNYHVAAWDRMLQNVYNFNGDDNRIAVDSTNSDHVIGIFSNEIDAAFVRVVNSTGLSNNFASGNYIDTFAYGPITTDAIGMNITVYSRKNPMGIDSILKNNSTIFNTMFNGLVLEKVIMIDKVTDGGDSGSAVMFQNTLLGIIVGADDLYSYVIPYHKINSFLSLQLI